jgi:hypothetical protein
MLEVITDDACRSNQLHAPLFLSDHQREHLILFLDHVDPQLSHQAEPDRNTGQVSPGNRYAYVLQVG